MSPGLWLIGAFLGMTGCEAPAVVEGVFSQETFHLVCARPLAKLSASRQDTAVVLAESDSEILRTVNLTLPNTANLPTGVPIAVGVDADAEASPAIDVIVGDLVVQLRNDGVEFISSANPVTAAAVTGSLTLDERAAEGVSGSFDVKLDDGGYLRGSFAALLSD